MMVYKIWKEAGGIVGGQLYFISLVLRVVLVGVFCESSWSMGMHRLGARREG